MEPIEQLNCLEETLQQPPAEGHDVTVAPGEEQDHAITDVTGDSQANGNHISDQVRRITPLTD